MKKRPSPLTNRVTPFGNIVAHPAHYPDASVIFGNRGCLHDSAYRVRKEFASTAWLACQLRVERTRTIQRNDNRVITIWTGTHASTNHHGFEAGARTDHRHSMGVSARCKARATTPNSSFLTSTPRSQPGTAPAHAAVAAITRSSMLRGGGPTPEQSGPLHRSIERCTKSGVNRL